MRIGLQAWGSEGDIRPFTALAARLVRAGHTVTLAVTDNIGRSYDDVGNRYGFRVISVGSEDRPPRDDEDRIWRRIIEAGNPLKQVKLVLEYGFDPFVESMYAASKQLCAEHDAVIGHFFVYPLRVAAERAAIPIATVNIVHNCIPSAAVPPPGVPNLGRWSYPLGWRLVQKTVNRIFLPRINALRVREGLAADSDVMTQSWAADRLNLIAVSPQICNRPPDWPQKHQICGFLNPLVPTANEDVSENVNAFLSAGTRRYT